MALATGAVRARREARFDDTGGATADRVAELEPERLADHGDRLFRAAYAMTGSAQDAEDLVQETYERILRRPRFVRRDGEVGYLLRVLRNAWSEHARSATRRRTQPTAPEALEWVSDRRAEPEAALETQAAYAAIAELSEPLRLTIVAVDVVGLSYAEAAWWLRTRTGTIMSRLYRAREQVAAALEAR